MSGDARWWVVEHTYLRSLLERARDGEGVDALLLETYANSDAEQVPGDADGPERCPECGAAVGRDFRPETMDICRNPWHDEGSPE